LEADDDPAMLAVAGRHSLTGTIHMDVSKDARIALRLLEKKFVALTDVSIASSDGDTQDYRTVW
jgi:predicted metal-dependent phosphotriesterase family hydrolase